MANVNRRKDYSNQEKRLFGHLTFVLRQTSIDVRLFFNI